MRFFPVLFSVGRFFFSKSFRMFDSYCKVPVEQTQFELVAFVEVSSYYILLPSINKQIAFEGSRIRTYGKKSQGTHTEQNTQTHKCHIRPEQKRTTTTDKWMKKDETIFMLLIQMTFIILWEPNYLLCWRQNYSGTLRRSVSYSILHFPYHSIAAFSTAVAPRAGQIRLNVRLKIIQCFPLTYSRDSVDFPFEFHAFLKLITPSSETKPYCVIRNIYCRVCQRW